MAEDRQHKGYMALLGRMQKGRKSKKREGSELHGAPICVAQVAAALLFAAGRWQLALALRRFEAAATGAGAVPTACR